MDKGLEARLKNQVIRQRLFLPCPCSPGPTPASRHPVRLAPGILYKPPRHPWASGPKWVPAGLWEEPGECWLADERVGRKGWARRKMSLEQAADWAGFSAWAPGPTPFFLPSAPRQAHALLSAASGL